MRNPQIVPDFLSGDLLKLYEEIAVPRTVKTVNGLPLISLETARMAARNQE